MLRVIKNHNRKLFFKKSLCFLHNKVLSELNHLSNLMKKSTEIPLVVASENGNGFNRLYFYLIIMPKKENLIKKENSPVK